MLTFNKTCLNLIKYNLKIRKISNPFCLKYSTLSDPKTPSPTEFERKTTNFKTYLNAVHKVPDNLFFNLVKHIENHKTCDPETALLLIESCGLNFVDLFPSKRQQWLNYLFEDLFRRLNIKYDHQHYEYFMMNTFANNSSFDVYKLSNQIRDENVLANLNINRHFIKQFCNLDQIKIALVHLKVILETHNFNSINFELYKENPIFNSDKFYDSFIEQVKLLRLDNETQYTNLFNPIIDYYFKINETKKVSELIELMNRINLKPNDTTNVILINGNLSLSNYNEAKKLFENSSSNLNVRDLLYFYSTIYTTKKNVDSNAQREFSDMILNKIPAELSKDDRIIFINSFMTLSNENKIDQAFALIEKFFKHELIEQDPIEKAKIIQNINVCDYFFKSLIEYENSIDKLIMYAQKYDCERENLKTLIYYSFQKNNTELSLKLISKLKGLGERIKTCYFYPLIINECNQLDQSLANNKSKSINIEKHLNFKRIESIIKKIRYEYNVLIGYDDLETILNILRYNSEFQPRKFIKFSNLSKIFDRNLIFKAKKTFDTCASIILSYRLDYMKKNRDKVNFGIETNQIIEDLNEIYNLIIDLNINLFDDPLVLSKLMRYLEKLSKINMIYENPDQLENNIAFKTIKLMNLRSKIKKHQLLIDINNHLLNYSLSFLENKIPEKQIRDMFVDFFQEVESKPNNDSTTNEEYPEKKEKIEDLINMVIELESKNKDPYPTVRRLLIKLCHSTTDAIENRIELINKYIIKLPDIEFTPKLCQELMVFFAKHTFDLQKPTLYFEKLVETNKQDFQVEPKKLLMYLDCLSRNRPKIEQFIKIFSSLKWVKSDDNEENIKVLTNILSESFLYKNSTSTEYFNLIEKIFESNFVTRNSTIASLAMVKFIDTYQLDNAFDYFKLNLTKYKTSVSEILLLSSLLKKYEGKVIKGSKLEELLQYFSKFYASNLAYNFLFLAHILNSDFYSANSIFNKNLNKEIDLNVLNRLINQFNSSKVYKRISRTFANRILNYRPNNQDMAQKYEIEELINKLNLI